MIEIVLLLACCCFIFIVVLAGWFLNRGEEGDECEGKDDNGTYEIDEDLKCVLKSCNNGYYKSGKECHTDQSGDTCVPTGTPKIDGSYITDKIGNCVYVRPECEEDLTITTQEGTLGACGSLDDIDPMEVSFHGNFFSPKSPVRGSEWIQELSSTTNRKEFIAHHQSPDNYCKMVRFELTKDGDNCNYKVVDAGYTTSPTASSTCTTKDSVLSHWGSKNNQSLAPDNTTNGYGIAQLKYNKYC